MGEDVDNVCTIRMISHQIMQDDPHLLVKATSKDPILTQVMHCVKERWPKQCSDKLQDYNKLDDSPYTEHGCVFYGSRVVIPASVQNQVLQFQLAKSAVCWSRIY